MGQGKAILTALAPISHVGQTISSHPTLTWYVPDTQVLTIEFYLYELAADANRVLVQQTNLQSQPGVMEFTLPMDQAGLEIGKRYYWQVVLLCDPNHPSRAIVAGAEIERIAASPDLTNALASARNLTERAEIYAKESLWYDAMSVAVDSGSKAAVNELLVRLKQLEVEAESEAEQESEGRQSERLNLILLEQ